MDVIAIYCKGCGALYYANSHPYVEDIPDIVKCALRGDRTEIVDTEKVRVKLETCQCPDEVTEQYREVAGCALPEPGAGSTPDQWGRYYRSQIAELQAEVVRLRGEIGAARRREESRPRALTKVMGELTEAQAEAERLRMLCAHAATIMNNYGNMINWPANVPQEYAATINKLREAANIEGAA